MLEDSGNTKMNTPHDPGCKCGHMNNRYCGMQRSLDPRTMRWYHYPYFNCDDGCGSSYGGNKTYIDTGEPVPPFAPLVSGVPRSKITLDIG